MLAGCVSFPAARSTRCYFRVCLFCLRVCVFWPACLSHASPPPHLPYLFRTCLQVYGIFSITGEQHPDASKNPYNTMIMVTDAGEVNLVYR